MSDCCNEFGCRRKQPIMLTRAGLSRRWYFVTRYKDDGDGNFVADEKHEVSEHVQQALNAAFPDPADDEVQIEAPSTLLDKRSQT